MAKIPANHGKSYTKDDIATFSKLLKQNTPTRVIALKMQRTEDAIQSLAQREDKSLKPVNQSPYGTKKSPKR